MIKVTLNNVLRISGNEYLTEMKAEYLLKMWANEEIKYVPEIQRGSVTKYDKKDNKTEVPVYSKSNINKIYNAMVSGNYYSDMLTFNIDVDNDNEIKYNNGDLEISADCLEISDGYHRIRALEKVKESNDAGITNIDLDNFKFPIKITYLDTGKAQQQFYQFSQGLKISSSRSEFFNSVDLANILVKRLMEHDKALDGLVETVKNNIAKSDKQHLVTFATLVNAIKSSITLDDMNEVDKWEAFLNEYFKELIELVPELNDANLRLQSKESSFVGENFMFYGYAEIAKILFDHSNWKDKLSLILKLDLNKGAKIWYGKVTKELKDGKFGIVNNNESRNTFRNKINKEFNKLLKDNQAK